jgi:Fe-S cluster biogenesis protein NfuA
MEEQVEDATITVPSSAAGDEVEKTVSERISDFIETMVNPSLAAHGGWVELTAFNDESGTVTMKMGGGCQGCGASATTMKFGVETALIDEFPEVNSVEDDTDHDAGENPFFMGNPFANI